jgi:hypothetical protein
MEEWTPIWRIVANILNKELRTADKVSPPASELGKVLTTPHLKTSFVRKRIHVPQARTDP